MNGILNDIVPMIAITGGILVAIVAIVCGSVRRMHRNRQREQSRREIAAYIAEGSMTPADGIRLMEAGSKPPGPATDD